MYAHFVGFYGWVGKIALERLYGSRARALEIYAEAYADYVAALGDKSVDGDGHQAISSGGLLFNEAWALDRPDLMEQMCTLKPRVCDEAPLASIRLSQHSPAQLEPLTLQEPSETKNVSEFLIALFLEQKRIGRCPLDQANVQRYVDNFRANGALVSIPILEKMRQECGQKRFSASLDSFKSRLTY
jgi:hypothetical protein